MEFTVGRRGLHQICCMILRSGRDGNIICYQSFVKVIKDKWRKEFSTDDDDIAWLILCRKKHQATCHSDKLEGLPKNLQFQNEHNYYKQTIDAVVDAIKLMQFDDNMTSIGLNPISGKFRSRISFLHILNTYSMEPKRLLYK